MLTNSAKAKDINAHLLRIQVWCFPLSQIQIILWNFPVADSKHKVQTVPF